MEDLCRGSTAAIKPHQKSEKEVRQGDTISPKLFTAYSEEVLKNLNWEDIGIKIDSEHFKNLRFTDDSVLLSEPPKDD